MAFKLVGGFPDGYSIEGTVTAGTAIAEGDMLAINGNVLQRATSSSTIHTIVGVAAETITTSDTKIKYIPIVQGQLWEVDTANNTDSTELYESMVLTDHDTVNNSDTDVTGETGVFLCLGFKGATSDKKLLGEFTRLQSTST
jgi:hypothetical protein